MMSDISIDEFLRKRYNRDRYNCAHFVCEVWAKLCGADISKLLESLLLPAKDRHASFSLRRVFTRLDKPVSPCIALMQRRGSEPHVGVFLRGRILHIHEMGVEFMPVDVASRGFDSVRFYTC